MNTRQTMPIPQWEDTYEYDDYMLDCIVEENEQKKEYDPFFEFCDERFENLSFERLKENTVDLKTAIQTLKFIQHCSIPMMKFNELISIFEQLDIRKDVSFVSIEHTAVSSQEGLDLQSLTSNFGDWIQLTIIFKNYAIGIVIYDTFDVYMLVTIFKHVKDHIFEIIDDSYETVCKNQVKGIFEVLKNN